MFFALTFSIYFVVLFLLPSTSKGTLARLRAWVVRRVERKEQLCMLIEDDFMAVIAAEKRGRDGLELVPR